MKSRFEPNPDAACTRDAQRLIDPEAFEASEQQFAASLESRELPPAARFVVDHAPGDVTAALVETSDISGSKQRQSPAEEQPSYTTHSETSSRHLDLDAATDPGAWRQEVAARLNKYRERRQPRAPRYPSLRLRFEPAQPDSTAGGNTEVPVVASRKALAEDSRQMAISTETKSQNLVEKLPPAKSAATEATAKIIEFPRSAAPPRPLDELAEPILDRPRILEAPEIVPAGPALGGILIEAAEEEPAERRPGFEIPLQPARLTRRIGAGATDILIVCIALFGFGYVFFRIAAIVPRLIQAAGWGMFIAGLFWVAYQYLFLVHAGTTPGLKIMKLQLSRFDGKPVPRGLRRWRVLASLLSGLSLGLGFAWCMLDEDELCWHDRITHTYMAPSP
jgi:uncharacterized RDD family membrane protein YckC